MVSNKLSGWYYDLQLGNRLTSATLHPNKIKVGTEWKTFSESNNPEFTEGDPDYSSYYSKNPICSAIITEDFNVSVANSWSDFGGDMIGQMWESVKPLAPYAGAFKEMLSKAVSEYESADEETRAKIQESTASRTLAGLFSAINNKLNNSETNITDYLNRALVVQGTRFSYYSGSGTSFGNLMMKFTMFPKFNGTQFKTVDEQVKELFPYCIGEYVSGTDGLKFGDSQKDKETQSLIDNMIGWQKAPGGFEAYVRNVDVIQPGTLMLRFGAFYAITNLVIENANFNFSKQMVKNPDPNSDRILSPLYCDVTIQLRPATKYSSQSLEEFVTSRGSTNTLKEVHQGLKENLDSLYGTFAINDDQLTNYVYSS